MSTIILLRNSSIHKHHDDDDERFETIRSLVFNDSTMTRLPISLEMIAQSEIHASTSCTCFANRGIRCRVQLLQTKQAKEAEARTKPKTANGCSSYQFLS